MRLLRDPRASFLPQLLGDTQSHQPWTWKSKVVLLPQNYDKDTAWLSCHPTTAHPSLSPPVGTPTFTSLWP